MDEVLKKEVRKVLHRVIAKAFFHITGKLMDLRIRILQKVFKSLQEIEELGQSMDVM